MTNLNIRIFGSSNLSQVRGDFQKLEAQIARVNAAMAAQVNQAGTVDPTGYAKVNRELQRSSQMYRQALSSTGMFHVEQLKVNSATSNYTDLLQKQKLGLMDIIKQQKLSRAAYKEQLAIQQMVARTFMDSRGKQVIDFSFPTEISKQVDTASNRLGWFREQARSASTEMVNWGKNTQWAGRQLMVGFTIPVLAAAAGMGVLAYQADQQLTRVAKVYDTYATTQMGKERELAQLRSDSLTMAKTAAEQYGASISDTLKVEAELAATGKRGSELRESTLETVRIATLGELDYGDAISTTIALQNAFKMSGKELTETFNYMNAVENATSLSIQDIAEATPRAAAAMASLGVSAKEMTVMLVAMKERGVDAAEGANALKSATTRILSPVKDASKYFGQLGIDINEMSDKSGGNLFKFLQLLAKSTEGLDDLTKQRGIAKLFGTYQYNRMNAALMGVTDTIFGMGPAAEASGSQARKAYDLMSNSASENAALAAQELERQANSASGQFKRALESIKVELADMGEPFLAMGADVMSIVQKIIKLFNSLPDPVKKGAAGVAIFFAAFGPLTMLLGLFANFAGNLIKVGVAVTGVATKFNLITKEQKAAQIAAGLAEAGFISETRALQNLTLEMQKYAQAQAVASKSALMPNIAPGSAGGGARPGQTGNNTASGLWIPGNLAASQAKNADESERAAAGSEKQSRFMKDAALSGTVLAGGMIASSASSNETVDNVANMAMLAALVAPALVEGAMALRGVNWKGIGDNISGRWAGGMEKVKGSAGGFAKSVGGASGSMGKLGMATRLAGSGIIGMIGPVGIVMAAVAAGAIAWKVISTHADKARKSVENMAGSSEGLGKILGFTPKEEGALDATSKKASDVQDRVNSMRAEVPIVIDRIKEATGETEKFEIAMQNVGLKTLDIGGNAEQAKEAVRLALRAAGVEADKAEALVLKYEAQFDPKGMMEQAQAAARQAIEDAKKVMTDKGFSENIMDPFTAVSRASLEHAETAGDKLAQAIKTSFDNKLSQSENMEAMDSLFRPLEERMAELERERSERRSKGEGSHDLDVEFVRLQKLDAAMKRKIITELAGEEVIKDVKDSELARLSVSELLAKATINITEKERYQYLNAKNLKGETLSLAEAQELSAMEARGVGKALEEASKGIKKTGAAAKDTRGFMERLAGTFTDTKAASQAFGDATVTGIKGAMSEYADQATQNFDRRMNAAMDAYRNNQEARMDALKSVHEKANDQLDAQQDAANRRLEKSQDSSMDRLEKRQDAQMKLLDNRQEAQDDQLEKRQENRRKIIEASYDSRIEKIEKSIDAEQKAEELRQRLFEAEQTRINRLAEMMNRNIDFNAALVSGDMDEAAKIMNDASAVEQNWALSDAAGEGQTASETRVTALQGAIDRINKEKDARLEALRLTEEAEKKSLQVRQERDKAALTTKLAQEKAALAASQEQARLHLAVRLKAEKDNLAARQRAEENVLSNRIQKNIAAEQRIWDSRKLQLDRAIKDFQAFAPRNAQELQTHINSISRKYDQFRVNTRGKFNGTAADVRSVLTRNIHYAMQDLVANQKWAAIGQSIASQMVKGSFNMNMTEFIKWVTTGQTPKGWAPYKAPKGPTAEQIQQSRNQKQPNRNLPTFHVGGQIGVDAGGRAGISGSGLHRSEMPIIAQRGEFMVNKDKAQKHLGTLKAINSGSYSEGKGAGPGPLGFAGLLTAGIASLATRAIGQAVATGAQRAIQRDTAAAMGGRYLAGKAGVYGDQSFGAEQLNNAAIIATVGANMGMSPRDIQIAIMTAITESGLRNLGGGDRDSVGLFQQRPSQGWGSVAQIMDPTYAATKFYSSLKGIGARGGMDPWAAAQAVQRSAFSDGSNYHQYWNEAMAIFSAFSQDPGAGGGLGTGPTGPANKIGRSAISWAQAHLGDEGWIGLCQKFVRMALGAGGGFPSAISAWGGAKHKHGIANPASVPAGVPVYWGGGRYGHVALSTGGGRIIGTDYPNMGRIGQGTITSLSRDWNKPLLGWTEDINGKRIFGLPGMKTGGFAMSDGLANLHGTRNAPEAVLTAPLTKDLKEGVRNFADGGGNSYTINVDAANARPDTVDMIVKKTIAEIKKIEARKPQSRKN